MVSQWEDSRYSQEARDHDLKIIWECNKCGDVREDYPGSNEGGKCYSNCGGEYVEAGESYRDNIHKTW